MKPFRKAMNFHHLSKEQTNILKGVGILLIVLHNYFHNLKPIIGEQEFYFSPTAARNFLEVISNRPEEIVRILFSYFGHYGVQIFIFLSAYGFTRKYTGTEIKPLEFFGQRTAKIYSAFFTCVVLYVVLGWVKEYFSGESVLDWPSLFWKMTALSNFIPGEALSPVGPWWFFSLIIQIYAVFPLLLKWHKVHGPKVLVAIAVASIVAELLFNATLRSHRLNINHTVLGHLPVICMGIYWGCTPKFNISGAAFVAALFVFLAANFHPLLWLVADVAFIVFFLYLQNYFLRYLPLLPKTKWVLSYFGEISLYLFLVNGFLRSPFHNFAQSHGVWWIDNVVSIASLVFSTAFALALQKLDHYSPFTRRQRQFDLS